MPRSRFIRAALMALRFAYFRRPAPLWVVLAARGLGRGADPLACRWDRPAPCGKLRNRFLAERLAGRSLGGWSLGVRTLNLMEREIRSRRPESLLEFGSGLSTACLARYMRELHGGAGEPRVWSLEQDPRHLEETRSILEELGLEGNVSMFLAPVTEQAVEGVETLCYDMSDSELREALARARLGMVVIDGPSGESGDRFATVPLAAAFARPGARFFLDDALRDAELRAAKAWDRMPCVRVEGIYVAGKGLLVGALCSADPTKQGKDPQPASDVGRE